MKILMIDHFPASMREQLRAGGQELRYLPEANRAMILDELAEVEVLVMNSKVKVDRELLDHAPCLQMLCRAGVGMDHFDLPLLAERGVQVVNTPGANAIPVGEQALGMILSLLHNIVWADRQVREFTWERESNRGTELAGKTVGIIGYGHTGSQVGKMLSGFGCKILAYDKYKTRYAPPYVEETGLKTIFEECDILTIHIPLTAETKGWIDEEFFDSFTKRIWFLNLARGPVLVLEGLIAALKKGKVIAAGLDVLENEKFATLNAAEKGRLAWLFQDQRVLFTPHIGGWSHESLLRINNCLVQAVLALAKNQ